MKALDWTVLIGTLGFIVIYGAWKTRRNASINTYLLGDKQSRWWTIGLSVMATQASAITFLSTPGQAFADGMRFVQFYFGLPIAMVVICISFIPIYHRLKVYTAYEFLESRFDLKTRLLTAFLFLVQRGLAAGITIYAPAIILTKLLGWPLELNILLIGILVIIYTVSGGTRAVAQTQKQQMAVIMGGMVIAFILILRSLPENVGFGDALGVAGIMDRMNPVTFDFDLKDKYNLWSGLIGGSFLALSYFGTDQSQVARYLSGQSIREMRIGLIFNGLLKVPMQFFILLCGLMVFVFYQFEEPPAWFFRVQAEEVHQTEWSDEMKEAEQAFSTFHSQKKQAIVSYLAEPTEAGKAEINQLHQQSMAVREELRSIVGQALPEQEANDKDYIFISWVLKYMPVGLVGLLLAVIFSAAMSSTSSELNALASTFTVDIYKRLINAEGSDAHYVLVSRLSTLGWGILAIIFAILAQFAENLIQAVNILGSLFYGTVLGIFLAAFYLKRIGGWAVFIAALIAEAIVVLLFFLDKNGSIDLAYLWLNLVGCVLVLLLALGIQMISPSQAKGTN